MRKAFSTITVFILFFASANVKAEEHGRQLFHIHHDIKGRIYPSEHRIIAEDLITVPEGFPQEFKFLLHEGLEPSSPTNGVTIIREGKREEGVTAESFKVKMPEGQKVFTLKYNGIIMHPLEQIGKEQARGFSHSPGIISDEGVYLSGGSLWYPAFEGSLSTFTLQIELPSGLEAVSQGERTHHAKEKEITSVRWDSPEPQDEILLVAGRFTEYSKAAGGIQAMAFLRTPDKELADKYLDATARYIIMYERLIGPYPYKKFALVENFWETGFGMPSFTLLGPKVIRLPFIINSSYPHEILHNWWGNSVFPEYEKGNWSEGLTAYLSDHLIKEQQGGGAEYRQATLQKYADYVSGGKDFPISEFRSRYSSSSEAVGYGKAMMFFHMLRLNLGDRGFKTGLQDFYRKNKFRLASFAELRRSFEAASMMDLDAEFNQWIKRSGAPKIRLSHTEAAHDGKDYHLAIVLEQTQEGDAYRLSIPIAVTIEGQSKAHQTVAVMDKKSLTLTLRLPSRPLRIDVDPEFDIFRRLDRDEIPPAISQALGAERMLILLPSSAKGVILQAYRDFAAVLGSAGPDSVEVKLDSEIAGLPADRAVTVLGWENRYSKVVTEALAGYDVSIGQKHVHIAKTKIPNEKTSVVLTSRNPENRDVALTFIGTTLHEALPGLGRKIPHYHKYSYLVFEGDEPVIKVKGRWPVLGSPMTSFLPGKDGAAAKVEMGGLAPREPIAVLPPVFSSELMTETVRYLSGAELKGRGFGTEGLEKAAEFISGKFKEYGLVPAGDMDGSYFQIWEDPEHRKTMKNIIGVIPGKKKEMLGQSVVVGAHYDHLGMGWPDVREENKGKIHPGADDNASGVAVLIELARMLGRSLNPDRSIVFVAFSGEEAGKRGSRHYVSEQKVYPADKAIGMVNLDTVGRLGRKKLLVIGAASAKEWMYIFRCAGFVTGVEIEAVAEKLDSSDQVSFEEAGVPAVQLFSGPHLDFHRPTDTPDKIDPEGLVRVASVAREVIEYLAGRQEPLTAILKKGESPAEANKKERRISLGAIPDFAYSGVGFRLSGVVPGSPAEACGLKEGDIIMRINSVDIRSLKELSDYLKTLSPGNRVSIIFLREGKEMSVEAEVVAR